MTRKGKLPIQVPAGVDVKLSDSSISVKGPKGSLEQQLMPGIHVKMENGKILVSRDEEAMERGNFHGLYRALIENMVLGAAKGFEKRLEMIGVGYRASVQGDKLNLQVGFSHPTFLMIPNGIEVKVERNTTIIVTGINKQHVGQFASIIRDMKPPEPYQGKGIRYVGEYVRRKAGKAAAKK